MDHGITMSYLGFEADLRDGSCAREADVVWDAVPDGIKVLRLKDSEEGVLVAIAGGLGRKFFFYNECVAAKGSRMGTLSAKVLGFIEKGMVYEWRVNMPDRSRVLRSYPAEHFEQSPSALRLSA